MNYMHGADGKPCSSYPVLVTGQNVYSNAVLQTNIFSQRKKMLKSWLTLYFNRRFCSWLCINLTLCTNLTLRSYYNSVNPYFMRSIALFLFFVFSFIKIEVFGYFRLVLPYMLLYPGGEVSSAACTFRWLRNHSNKCWRVAYFLRSWSWVSLCGIQPSL